MMRLNTSKLKKFSWLEPNVINIDRNAARDTNLFRPLQQDVTKNENLLAYDRIHTGDYCQVVQWKWPGDDRVFYVPVELFQYARLMGMARDVIAASTQMYLTSGDRANLMVKTSTYKLANLLGLSTNGKNIENIMNILTFCRAYTIKNYPWRFKNEKGRIETQYIIFGFIDGVGRTVKIDDIAIPTNKQPVYIHINKYYSRTINDIIPAPVPVKALEIAHQQKNPIVANGIKNIAYYLASRIPDTNLKFKLEKLREICNISSNRKDKVQKAIENILSKLNPFVIEDYNYDGNIYHVILAGRKRS